MPLFRDRPPLPQDPLFRALLLTLVGSALGASVLMLLWQDSRPAWAEAAGWAALLSIVAYFLLRLIGAARARRQDPERPD